MNVPADMLSKWDDALSHALVELERIEEDADVSPSVLNRVRHARREIQKAYLEAVREEANG